jgi:hypothetical protein
MWSIFEHFKFEANDVIEKTKPINTLIKSAQNLLNKITNKKRYTHNDKFRFDQILEVIKTNPDVRENLFAKNYFSFNSKKRHMIARLHECYNNYEKCRSEDTPVEIEKRS